MPLKYTVDYGMLQAADINPAAPGVTTAGLTNPQLEENEELTEEIMSGQYALSRNSPLFFAIVILVGLFAIGYLQKAS